MGDRYELDGLIDAATERHLKDHYDVLRVGDQYCWLGPTSYQNQYFPAYSAGGAPEEVTRQTAATYPSTGTTEESIPLGEIYRGWENNITTLFAPFQDMPEAGDFDGALGTLDDGLAEIQVDASQAADATSGESDDFDFAADGSDAMAVGTGAGATFALFQGATSAAFKTAVLDRFGLVVTRQFAAGQMVKAGVMCEKEVWKRLDTDVPNLITCATNAFKQDSDSVNYTIVGALISVAGLIPGVSAVATVGGAVVSVLSELPDGGGAEEDTGNISGGDADSIYDSLVEEVDRFKDLAADQEQAMAEKLRAVSDYVSSNPAEMDMTSQREVDDSSDGPTPGQQFGSETEVGNIITDKGELVVEVDTMRGIGEDFRDVVAPAFARAANKIGSALGGGSGWSRSGGIGYGYTGHFSETYTLAETVENLLRDQKQLMERAGDVLVITSSSIDRADTDAETRLNQHRAEVEAAEQRETEQEQPITPPRPYTENGYGGI